MRPILPILLLLLALAAAGPSFAQEEGEGMLDSLRKQAEPLLYALSLVGTPYKAGGTDPAKGTDCSGFVRHVYKQTAGVELPHNARAMSQNSEKIGKDELKPGDLVFFNTLKKPFSHVGIYTGDGKFVHSSSQKTKQVEVSSLNQKYWAERYEGARRVISTQ